MPNGSSWILDGDLTIKDVTKPVTLDFDFGGLATDPWGNQKAAFSATTTINREDWDLSWNVALETGGVLVSKKINIEIEMQAVPVNGYNHRRDRGADVHPLRCRVDFVVVEPRPYRTP